jgi:WD40 repeat protein
MKVKEDAWELNGRILCNNCFTIEVLKKKENITATKADLSSTDEEQRICSKCGAKFEIKSESKKNTGKPEKTKEKTDEMPLKKPKPKSPKTGTVIRQPDKATPITKEKGHAEPVAFETAEEKDWQVKSLPVWQPGDIILDTYEVEDVISGGMGHVYIANHNKWNVKLAIKSPNEMMLENKSNFARILREANSWTELGLHPNIAYCYYVRNIEEVPHIFVEYVDGGDLKTWIEEGKCLNYRVNLDLAIQFCHGMEFAHSKGMIHRDIKPANVLITKEGILKITDFGLVRRDYVEEDSTNAKQDQMRTEDERLTSLGEMGTPGYYSPEQFSNPHEVDEKTDIFAFGVCLYEMFCGNRPYEVTFGPRQEPPDPVSLSGDANFPSDIGKVLTKAVQWDPIERYKSFDEIRQEFLRIYHVLYGEDSLYAELELLDVEADGLNNQGVSYFDLGRKDDAIACWEKALKINKLHPEATFNLSLIQWRDGKIADDEVLKCLDNCEKNPSIDREKIEELKSLIHAERMDFDSARNILKENARRYNILFHHKNIDQREYVNELIGHTDLVMSVALSSDGLYAVSGSWDNTVRVWELFSGRCIGLLEGHTGGIVSIVISPDGRFAMSASLDNTARIWCLETGQCVQILEGHTGRVESVAFNHSGHCAVSGSWDNTVRVWGLSSGRCIKSLKGHTHWIHSVTFSPDDQYVVSGSWDSVVKVWEVKSGRCMHTLKGHGGGPVSVVISPDGRYVITGCHDKSLRVWELVSGQCIHTLKGHSYAVLSVAITTDGIYAVSGSQDKTLRVWELASGKCVHSLVGHTGGVQSVAVSPTGRYAVSGSDDKTLRLWELATGRCLRTMSGHTDEVHSVAFSPVGKCVLSGSNDTTLRVWEIISENPFMADLRISVLKGFKVRKKEEDTLNQAITQARGLYEKGDYNNSYSILYEAWKGIEFRANKFIDKLYSNLLKKGRIKGLNFSFQKSILKGHTGGVRSVTFSPDCMHAFSGGWDKSLRQWEIETGQCQRKFSGHNYGIHSISIGSAGRYAVSGSQDKTVRVWELAKGHSIYTLKGHTNDVFSVCITPAGRYAVSGSQDKTVRVWEITIGKCVHSLLGHTGGIQSVAVSPDSRYVISGSWDNTVRVWELNNGQCVLVLEGHTNDVFSVCISSDGRYVVSGSRDNTLRVWNLENCRCVSILRGHRLAVQSVAISPDSRYVVSGSDDNTVRLWELESNRCILILEGHSDLINSVDFSPDGRYVLSGSEDKTARVWELIWDLEFPDPVDWDEGVRAYLEIFLTLRNGKWAEDDFQSLLKELAEKCGYGWVRPEGIRKELEKMTKDFRS